MSAIPFKYGVDFLPKMKASQFIALTLAALAPVAVAKTPDGKPLIVLIAGKPSHGPGEHEHNAGVQLLAKCLGQGASNVSVKVHLNAEWPDDTELAQADTVAIYSDGGGGHPMLKQDHLASLRKEMDRGCGFVCLHYAVEFPSDKGGPEALDWMGGFFEANWSVNPHWTATYNSYPKHPVANGVKPFTSNDEWYFHMRFRSDEKGTLTHILQDIPPESTMSRKDGPHEGNPTVRAEVAAKKPQTMAWAFERPNGGRGFGFTGGHFHKGWANDDQRKLVLNALLWTAKVEVPAKGVESAVTAEDLEANLDPKGKPKSSSAIPSATAPIAKSKILKKGDAIQTIRAELKGAKELHLAIADGGDGFTCDWADWIEPELIKADGTRVKLTTLEWKLATSGFGKVRIGANAGGGELRVNGERYTDGIGSHAVSIISYSLPSDVVAFESKAGLDNGGTDQAGGDASSVQFLVFNSAPDAGEVAPTASGGGGGANRYGLEKAKANMATFTTASGLKASLVAAEPMIVNPTNIDIDHKNRVWAVECVNYRKYGKIRPEGDRVVVLEDTNGDGEADKSKTFFQSPEMTNPLGICVLPQPKGTKVIVSAAPNVWLLTDKDGDDVCDEQKIIFKTTGVWDYDHQIHAFVFGPDGKFYFNFGDAATSLTWPDGKPVKDVAGNEINNTGKPYRKGMVLRCDLDLETGVATNIETLASNFRNNYEVTLDSFGTLWQSDNDDDGNKAVRINYVMEFGNYGYTDEVTGAGWRTKRTNLESEIPKQHWYQNDPGVVPNILITGAGSPTGILINEGKGLGAAFENQMIHCDAGPRTTRAYPVEKDGAGYKATMVDILTGSDSWYRAADVALGTDGALVIADWYDPGVGGHAMGDHEAGQMMGRIYRVAAGDLPKAAVPDFTTAEGAVKALQSPNRATRYMAWTALHKLGAKAEPALQQLWKSDNARMRARALGLLAQVKGSETKYLAAGLKDADENVRIWAVRLCSTLSRIKQIDTTPLEEDRALVAKLMRDTSAVRRQIAIALHGAKDIDRLWAALAVQHDGKDRWYLEALGIGAAGNEAACFDTWLGMIGDKWNTPAGRDIIWRIRSPKAAEYLARLILDPAVDQQEKRRYLREFDFLPTSEGRSKALTELATSGKAADDLAREALIRLKGTDLNANPSVALALKAALANVKGTPQFIELARDFGVKGVGPELLETAVKFASDPLATEAVRLTLEDPKSDEVLSAALSSANADQVINLLGTTATNRGLDRLVEIAADLKQKPEIRQQSVRALARTQAGAERLVKLAQSGKFSEDLKSTATSALAMVQYASLKDLIAQLFPMPNALGGQPLPPVVELARLKGDAGKGRAVFERAESSCVTCHKIGDKGIDFGPNLSEIGGKLPKEALYDAIINPNAGVSMGFETWEYNLKDGGAAMGILRSETSSEVVLALPAGATMKVNKGDIVRRSKLTNSMMPSGLNQALSKDDLVNLVEYLASLKTK
jgi:putative membrane-bound dehydrogenase-like protein